MIVLLNLIKIEIKRVLRFLPYIMVGALALCFIIGIISFSASKVLYKKNDNKIKIAISIPKNEQSAKYLISIIEDMKSVKENCDFVEVDNENEAYKKVENGQVYGAIIIPSNFVSDILNGTNTPATVLLPDKSSIQTMLIKDLVDAGTKSLASAQAGIYAIGYEYEQDHHEFLTKALEDDINIKYMDYTLPRESYFDHRKISATGELTILEYYACSGVVLFMLLLGMSFSKYLCPSNKGFYEKLKLYRNSKGIITLARIISVSIIYLIITILMFLAYIGVCKYTKNDFIDFSSIDFFSLIIVILCVSSFIVCIFTIIELQISGTLLLFISTIAMNFISGGFLPKVFLPKTIQDLAPYMLTNVLSKQIGNIILKQFSLKEFLKCVVMLVVIYLATGIIVTIKKRIGSFETTSFSEFRNMKENRIKEKQEDI